MPMQPVTGPAVWTARDIATRDDWKIHIDESALAEVPRLLDAASDSGMTEALGRERFPALHRTMATVRTHLLEGSGFVLLKGFPVRRYSNQQLEQVFIALGRLVGRPVSQNSYGDLIASVQDEGKRLTTVGDTKGVRGYLSNEKLLFHTDLADAVGLLCINTAKEGGMSSITSSMSVFNEILANHPDYLPVYFAGFPFWSTEADGAGREWRIPVFDYENGVLSCAIRRAMIETSRLNGIPYTELEKGSICFRCQK